MGWRAGARASASGEGGESGAPRVDPARRPPAHAGGWVGVGGCTGAGARVGRPKLRLAVWTGWVGARGGGAARARARERAGAGAADRVTMKRDCAVRGERHEGKGRRGRQGGVEGARLTRPPPRRRHRQPPRRRPPDPPRSGATPGRPPSRRPRATRPSAARAGSTRAASRAPTPRPPPARASWTPTRGSRGRPPRGARRTPRRRPRASARARQPRRPPALPAACASPCRTAVRTLARGRRRGRRGRSRRCGRSTGRGGR